MERFAHLTMIQQALVSRIVAACVRGKATLQLERNLITCPLRTCNHNRHGKHSTHFRIETEHSWGPYGRHGKHSSSNDETEHSHTAVGTGSTRRLTMRQNVAIGIRRSHL